jgi:hypothetical protein
VINSIRAHLTGRTHGRTDQSCIREESPCQLGAVHTWHLADIASATSNVRYRGRSGHRNSEHPGLLLTHLGHPSVDRLTMFWTAPATQGIDDLRDGAASTIDAGCPFWNYPLDLMPIFDFEILRPFVLVE